jgi:hypothetical protein
MKETEFMEILGRGKYRFVDVNPKDIVAKLTANGRRVLTAKTDDGKKLMKFVSEELYNKYKTGKTIHMSKKKSAKRLMKSLRKRKSKKSKGSRKKSKKSKRSKGSRKKSRKSRRSKGGSKKGSKKKSKKKGSRKKRRKSRSKKVTGG